MQLNYITADTHFGHIHINTYEPSRMGKAQMEGYDYFDHYMIDAWNETVKENDTVLHLGDFAFKDGYKVAKKLKGKITLIKGNHDRSKHLEYYRNLGWRIIDSIEVNLESISTEEQSGYEEILKRVSNSKEHKLTAALITEFNGKRILFSHFPVFDDNPYDVKYKATTSVLEELYILFNCELNIHGHTHSAGAKEKFCKSACLELNDFKLLKV
jgi:calcineurin-like phosphoesterase family protein